MPKKGIKAAPYDTSTPSAAVVNAAAAGLETLTSIWQSSPLPPLPDFITGGGNDEAQTQKPWWKGGAKGKAKRKADQRGDDLVQKSFAVLQMALSWYLSLDSQSQRYVGWGFLAFTCLFVSGLWTLKIGLAVLLLLMKPVSPSQTPVQKQKKKQRDADGRAFSTDPRLSAFQRIADSVTTYGNVPASKSTSALDTSPSPRASSSTPSPPPVQKESDLVAMPEPAAMPDVPRRLPSNPSPPPPLPPTLRSQTDTAIIAAPLPNPHDANHRAASPSPSSSTEAGQWQRKPSGSFHRIEVAKKFVNRKFGGAGSRATSGTGVLERSVSSPAGCDLDAEQPPQKEVLRESIPTEHGWVLEDRRPAI